MSPETEPSAAADESVAPGCRFPRRIRLRYGRQGPVRFLSHLDLIKSVERAIRRSRLPAAYTEGFHPRLRLAFASALPVGAESQAEYMDLDLKADSTPTAVDVRDVLNAVFPAGLQVLEAREVQFPCKSLGALVGMSVWQLTSQIDQALTVEALQAVMAATTLSVIRRSQRRDIRPYLERLDLVEARVIEAWIRIEQSGSVKPDELLGVLGLAPTDFRACRTALLWRTLEGWQEPWGERLM